jgi:hypothetical protein
MSENLESIGSSERPSFLTVLCILTFIGSGLGLLGGILGLVGSSALSMFAPEGSMIGMVFGLLAAGLCLFGAVKMWGLYKQGFMLYVAGCAVSIIGGLVSIFTFKMPEEATSALNTASGGEYNELATQSANALVTGAMWTAWIIGLIICVVFILMYNANRKHLVN